MRIFQIAFKPLTKHVPLLAYCLLSLVVILPVWIGISRIASPLFISQQSDFFQRFNCVSYDPRYRFSHFSEKQLGERVPISPDWIEADLIEIRKVSHCVRTYSSTLGMEEVPPIAARLGMQVILGVALRSEREKNLAEISTAIHLANTYSNISCILVGNEHILGNYLQDREALPNEVLYESIWAVANETNVAVSTAEPLASWEATPQLVSVVDFIALNELPYWAKVNLKNTNDWLDKILARAKNISQTKPITFSEIGWPTDGPQMGEAVPGNLEAKEFLLGLDQWSRRNGVPYNVMEAFDQPWKLSHHEGRVGAHWGLWDARGSQKFQVQKRDSDWLDTTGGFAIALSLVMLLMLPRVNIFGIFYTVFTLQTATLILSLTLKAAYAGYIIQSYQFLLVILPSELFLLFVVLVVLRETAPILGNAALNRHLPVAPKMKEAALPFVSIHLPCSNEPPDIVIESIKSLIALEYPNFEILVIDNNSSSEDIWKPVEHFCESGPSNLKFFHEEVLSGFKSGALNYALSHTDPRAEIVGVIDADYVVNKKWLLDLVPYLLNESVAAVQAPQANRSWQHSKFQTALRDEYEGFFHIGMVVRNEANALIQHGSMLLLRRSALEEVGRWAEWCITEDSELGLRLLEAGYEVQYICREYGTGLVPTSYRSYTQQRFRWAYGAMTILLSHTKSLLRGGTKLTPIQRFHFLTGWLPWISDVFVLLFSILGLGLVGFTLYSPLYFPAIAFSFPIIFFFLFRQLSTLLAYHKAVRIGVWRTCVSSVAGISLTSVIALGVLTAVCRRPYPFLRTRKGNSGDKEKARRSTASFAYMAQCLIGNLLVFGAIALVHRYGISDPHAVSWSIALVLLGLPGICVPFMHLLERRAQTRRY